jgi:hypothetical protein
MEVCSLNKLTTAVIKSMHDKSRTGNKTSRELCTQTARKSLQCKILLSLLHAFRNETKKYSLMKVAAFEEK